MAQDNPKCFMHLIGLMGTGPEYVYYLRYQERASGRGGRRPEGQARDSAEI
jgi:hypothetical protein